MARAHGRPCKRRPEAWLRLCEQADIDLVHHHSLLHACVHGVLPWSTESTRERGSAAGHALTSAGAGGNRRAHRRHCMMLENYDTGFPTCHLNMARKGFFGVRSRRCARTTPAKMAINSRKPLWICGVKLSARRGQHLPTHSGAAPDHEHHSRRPVRLPGLHGKRCLHDVPHGAGDGRHGRFFKPFAYRTYRRQHNTSIIRSAKAANHGQHDATSPPRSTHHDPRITGTGGWRSSIAAARISGSEGWLPRNEYDALVAEYTPEIT